MSIMQDIQEQLQDTEAALAEVDRAMSATKSPALLSMAKSLQKRQAELESRFMSTAKELGRKVCSYRLFRDDVQPKLSGLASALGNFQSLFSITFDALKNGPKDRARMPAEIEQASSFEFAYAFTGSVGIVLTMQDEQILFGETEFDRTVHIIGEMLQAETPDKVAEFAVRLGTAPIRTMYKWAKSHAQSSLGAEIQWQGGNMVQEKIFVQAPEFERLVRTIAATSEERIDQVTVEGVLMAASVTSGTFSMDFPGSSSDSIRGTFKDAIGEDHTVTLPKKYRAFMTKTVKIKYSTDEEEIHYFLNRLEEI